MNLSAGICRFTSQASDYQYFLQGRIFIVVEIQMARH